MRSISATHDRTEKQKKKSLSFRLDINVIFLTFSSISYYSLSM